MARRDDIGATNTNRHYLTEVVNLGMMWIELVHRIEIARHLTTVHLFVVRMDDQRVQLAPGGIDRDINKHFVNPELAPRKDVRWRCYRKAPLLVARTSLKLIGPHLSHVADLGEITNRTRGIRGIGIPAAHRIDGRTKLGEPRALAGL